MYSTSEKGYVEPQAVMWDLTPHNTLVRCSGTCIKIKDVRIIEVDRENQ